jgi:hypothetical protein
MYVCMCKLNYSTGLDRVRPCAAVLQVYLTPSDVHIIAGAVRTLGALTRLYLQTTGDHRTGGQWRINKFYELEAASDIIDVSGAKVGTPGRSAQRAGSPLGSHRVLTYLRRCAVQRPVPRYDGRAADRNMDRVQAPRQPRSTQLTVLSSVFQFISSTGVGLLECTGKCLLQVAD